MTTQPQVRILYIDDTAPARLLVRRVLMASDYLVFEADDPIRGIELAMKERPDLVLIDINLPGLSGREVATRLKDLLPDVPLVALTADTSPGAREKALVAGCVGFLTKPILVDSFVEQVEEYLHGKREKLADAGRYREVYQAELVERLEDKVRQLSGALDHNADLLSQNQAMIEQLQRRGQLLEAAARLSQDIVTILDMDRLLAATTALVCERFGFAAAGIYLLDGGGDSLVRRAAAGLLEQEADPIIPVAADLPLARACRTRQPSLDPSGAVAQVALPLLAKGSLLGALQVQGRTPGAFADEDMAALQVLANSVAVALQNASLLSELERANAELLRSKTFQAIATATGEAIHWVGNKAAPIPASVDRVRQDLLDLLAVAARLLELSPDQRAAHPLEPLWAETLAAAQLYGADLAAQAGQLQALPAPLLAARASLDSILEDLQIIERGARTILDVKEDLIGPARLLQPQALALPAFLAETLAGMGLPPGAFRLDCAPDLPLAWVDLRQLGHVVINLVKNAWEALNGQPSGQIIVRALPAGEAGFILMQVQDNGPGIPPEILDKIWVSFYTTKASRGGTGLGLSACLATVQAMGGRLWAESQVGQGATFSLLLPVAKPA